MTQKDLYETGKNIQPTDDFYNRLEKNLSSRTTDVNRKPYLSYKRSAIMAACIVLIVATITATVIMVLDNKPNVPVIIAHVSSQNFENNSNESKQISDEVSLNNASISSKMPAELRFTFETDSIDKFIEWINNGGDEYANNKEFLKTVKSSNDILMPISKNENFNVFLINLFNGKSYYQISLKAPKIEGNKLQKMFILNFYKIDDNDMKLTLDENLKKFCPELYNDKIQLLKGTKEDIVPEYIYTNYTEGASLSEAFFIKSGYLVALTMYWEDKEKPWNDEYLEYVDFELLQLDIKKD